jgi:hypothetical protein
MATALHGGEWTYSGNPSSSVRDEVRFWMQDVDTNLPLMSDTEIDYLINTFEDQYGSAIMVAAIGCEVLSAKFASEVAVSADGVSVGTSELQQKYNMLAESLRDQYKSTTGLDAAPLVGGILFNEAWDSTIKPLMFGIGFMDNYRAGRQHYGDYAPGEGNVYVADEEGINTYEDLSSAYDSYGAIGESRP